MGKNLSPKNNRVKNVIASPKATLKPTLNLTLNKKAVYQIVAPPEDQSHHEATQTKEGWLEDINVKKCWTEHSACTFKRKKQEDETLSAMMERKSQLENECAEHTASTQKISDKFEADLKALNEEIKAYMLN